MHKATVVALIPALNERLKHRCNAKYSREVGNLSTVHNMTEYVELHQKSLQAAKTVLREVRTMQYQATKGPSLCMPRIQRRNLCEVYIRAVVFVREIGSSPGRYLLKISVQSIPVRHLPGEGTFMSFDKPEKEHIAEPILILSTKKTSCAPSWYVTCCHPCF